MSHVKSTFRIASLALVCLAAIASIRIDTRAQAPAPDPQPTATREPPKPRLGPLDVGIVASGVSGGGLRVIADLAAVLDDDKLRVLPIIGRGGIENVEDLFRTRRADAALVQLDVLAHLRRDPAFSGADRHLQYVAKLHNEEIHLLVRDTVGSVGDLAGQKVSVGTESVGAITAAPLFDALGIRVELTVDDPMLALEKLRKGEIAAMLFVSAKPAPLLAGLRDTDRLRLVALPALPSLFEVYLPTRLETNDYPHLIAPDKPIETLAIGVALLVVPGEPGGERAAKLARFTEAMFTRISDLQRSPRHPKWREVSLSAQIPGWTRFKPAQDWLARNAPSLAQATPEGVNPAHRELFERFFASEGRMTGSTDRLSDRDRDELFQRFLRWKSTFEN